MTALISAAYYGHTDVIKVLIEAGASIEAKDDVSKRITKRNTNRLREWRKEKKKRIRVREKMKTLEKRKKEKQKFIGNMCIEEIQK